MDDQRSRSQTSQRTLSEAVSEVVGSTGLEMIFGIFRAAWENARQRDLKLQENAPLSSVTPPAADPRTMASRPSRSRSSITELEIALDWDPDAPTDAVVD